MVEEEHLLEWSSFHVQSCALDLSIHVGLLLRVLDLWRDEVCRQVDGPGLFVPIIINNMVQQTTRMESDTCRSRVCSTAYPLWHIPTGINEDKMTARAFSLILTDHLM